ncbi:MAG: sugar phosphate nucleotidyltransferase [Thermotogota bacterium]|nr:sugar phosphate nucleotidyltransferase [Thermotogota bacterium]
MKIIILAAGLGKRLKTELPKPLVPIKNKPMVEHIINKIKFIDKESEIIMVIRKESQEQFEKHLASKNLQYVFQEKQLGTANALKCALKNISSGEELLIMYSDTVLIREESLKKLIDKHRENDNTVTFLSGISNNRYPYALVVRNEKNRIIKMYEKKLPQTNPPFEFYVGPIIINSEAARAYINEIEPDPDTGEYYIANLVNRIIENNYRVQSLIINDEREYLGVNTPEDFKQAESLLHTME